MPLSASDIAALSRLLDEALDLNAAQREAWLHNMPTAGRHLVPKLREMLAERNSTGASGFLAALPALDPTHDHDEATARAGELVGPYRLIREIGRGGMGTVWLAERADGSFKRQVALKLPRLAWGAGLAKRMARERDIGAMLEHPNIARLYDAGVDERGRPFIALEHIDGIAIDAWCRQNKLSVRDKLQLIVQVAKAVAYAHGRLVVHRDLKPSNVMVSADGQVHLLDFGIARLLDDAQTQEHAATQEQVRVLTPHYASPEQLKGETLTVQSDVYSLGVLAYELLTGQMPYDAKRNTPAAIEEAILQGEVIAPSQRVEDRALSRQLKGDIDAIVGKAMKVEQSQRYATADALAADIQRYLTGETVGARPDSRGYRLRKMLKRHWIGASASAAVLVSILTGAGIAVVQAQRAAKAAEQERAVKEFVAEVFRVNVKEPTAPGELRSAPAEAFLEHSAKLVKARFDGQPAMQAELYAVVGKAFEDMGAFRLASEYAQRRLSALEVAGAGRLDLAQALIDLARPQWNDGKPAEGEKSARRASELAEGHDAIALEAQVLVAVLLRARGQIDQAGALLDQIEARLAALPDGGGVTAVRAMRARADWLESKNRHTESRPMYDAVIAKAISIQGPDSIIAAHARIAAAWSRASNEDVEGTTRLLEAGLEVLRRVGHEHRIRAARLSARFAVYREWQIPNSEVLAVIAAARTEIAATGRPVPSEMARDLDFDEGGALANWGKVEAALPLVERSAPAQFKAASGPVGRFLAAARFGELLTLAGRHDEADRWLRERFRARVESGQAKHPLAAADYYHVANNLRMSGRLDEAQSFLATAPEFPPSTLSEGSDPYVDSHFLTLMASDLALARGDTARALKIFPLALLVPPSGLHPSAPIDTRAEAVYGRVLCANARYQDGLALMREVVAHYAANHYEHDPRLALRRTIAGQCALGAGDRQSALGFAQQARESFTVQPGVSDFFKAPLLELEAKLAQR